METKVLEQEEIQQIKNIQQERSSIIEQFGIIEFNIQELEQQKQQLKISLINLKQREVELGQTLQEKYGDGTINIEKGEFTSSF